MNVKIIATNNKGNVVYMSVFTDDNINDISDITDNMIMNRIREFVHSKRAYDISDLDIVKIQVK